MPRKALIPLLTAFAVSPGLAAEELDTVQIHRGADGERRAGEQAATIQQTEVITAERLRRKQANSLADAVDNEPGVHVNNECSMCAIKRVMLNGLKGEHTTILVDGVPMHSVVSSYYGMDAVTAAGIERVEIARGAGASLIAPEAIGGTLNVITKRAERDGVSVDLSGGEHGYRRTSLEGTAVADDGATRATIAGQFDDQDRFDADDNGVAENPARENRSLTTHLARDLDANDTVELRVGSFHSTTLGGPTGISEMAGIRTEADGASNSSADYFAGGDVRREWTGQPWETLETIETQRDEYTLRWRHDLADGGRIIATGSRVDHTQDSFYEGFDYANDDTTHFGDLRWERALGMDHFLTLGLDHTRERMTSESDFMDRNDIAGDAFDHRDTGLYLQDIWTPTADLEVKLAARLDRIRTDWTEKTAEGDEIDTELFAPRAHVRWRHTDHWTSRFGAGRGYRAPLTFFESEHGILEEGFDIDIDEVETSQSASYALSYRDETRAATLSLAHTRVEDLAYIDSAVGGGDRPTLVNSDDTARVTTADLSAGAQLGAGWRVDGSLAHFAYGDDYKETFAVAPVEDRLRLETAWEGSAWSFDGSLNVVGERDLTDYGYGGRYNRWDDANDNGEVDDGELRDPKETDAPAWFTVDLRLNRELDETFSAYLGVNNLFDYTQAGDEETPLFYEGEAGSGKEAAFDVAHIYAPLRGRVVYAGLRAEF
ncbi:MAG: TonB-dependent receptor plug domain-containing protein [Pseudomonadota bacterium]